MFSAELHTTHAGVGASADMISARHQAVGTYIRRQLVMSCMPISSSSSKEDNMEMNSIDTTNIWRDRNTEEEYKRDIEKRSSIQGSSKCYILRESQLTPEQRSRLYHWILGHCSTEVPVKLTKDKLADGIRCTHALNEDCKVCDAAKFREQPHTRRSLVDRTHLPPYHTVYVDGFGGQQKFKVRSMSGAAMPDSFHGAKGGYVFCCAETDAIDVRLAASKDQFPRLLRSYLRAVQIEDYVVRVIVLDNAAEFMSRDVEDILDEYDIAMKPASPYTPQGNSLAENAVQIVCRIGRALMLGAPHLPSNRWGLAVKYACHINLVLPKKRLGGKTPYESIKGRIPDLRRLYYKVFGAPLVYKVGGKAQQQLSAIDSRVADGHFVGIDRPSVLVDTGDKIVARAMTKVRVYQGRYCEIDSAEALDQVQVEKEEGVEEEIPVALPSVRSLRDADDPIDQGENDTEEEVYDEDNLEIDKPEVQVQLKDKVKSEDSEEEEEEEEKQSDSEEEDGGDKEI